jgi:glycosyltransferase involved in cell wall biosynthesis
MNILLLNDDLEIGGVPRHVTDLANGLAARGHRVVVAATDGPMRPRLSTEVEYVPLQIIRSCNQDKDIVGTLSSMLRLTARLRHQAFDLIHSHKRYSDLLARILARRHRIRHISTCHNAFNNHIRVSVFGEYTIACAAEIGSLLVHRFRVPPDRICTIYCGIDPIPTASRDEIRSLCNHYHLSPNTRVFGTVGHLSPAKDHATLLRAIKILEKEGHLERAVCFVAGDGSERMRLSALAYELGLSAVVRFLDPTEASNVLQLAEFFVLTSRCEGLPYVLLEAASLGKPFIATDVGGVREFVLDGVTGLLVPPERPDRIAQSIQRLLNDPALVHTLGASARRLYEARHTFSSFISNTERLYKQALSSLQTTY